MLLLLICMFILNIKSDEYDIVTLNLQGTKFETTRQTLYRIPYFKSLSLDLDKSSIFYMDRSAHIFKHILAWSVDNRYPFPYKYRSEADFFNIDHKDIIFEDNCKNQYY